MSYSNPWLYNGSIFDPTVEELKNLEGFVYIITCKENDKKYIGKKSFKSRTKKKGATRRSTSESDWKKYYGSSDLLKEDIDKYGKDAFFREILHLCKYKKTMTYLEEREQFLRNVLTDHSYYNTNIAGRFFRTSNELIYEGVQLPY